MRKFIRLAATSMVAVAVIIPATANAAASDLRGAPTLRRIDTHHARLLFATDQRLILRNGSGAGLRVAFSGGQHVSSIVAIGRHGGAYRYTAQVSSQTELRTGAEYRVRFRFGRQPAKVRLVKLPDR
jgi:hypothetical protein